MPNPVVHFEVIGRNAEALQKFYGDAFGWTFQGAMENYSLAMTGSPAGIDGGIGSSDEGQWVTVYVEVDDPQKTLDKAAKLGAKTVLPVSEVVPGQVTIATFTDPEGRTVGLVKSGPNQPRADAGGKHPVVHFEINGADGKKLQAFYAELFGWHVNADNPMNYGEVDPHSDHGIGGGIGEAESPDQQWVTFYVAADDLPAALAKIERAGGKTVTPPTEIPGVVTFAHFADPEGHLIGLVKSGSY